MQAVEAMPELQANLIEELQDRLHGLNIAVAHMHKAQKVRDWQESAACSEKGWERHFSDTMRCFTCTTASVVMVLQAQERLSDCDAKYIKALEASIAALKEALAAAKKQVLVESALRELIIQLAWLLPMGIGYCMHWFTQFLQWVYGS